MKAMSVIPGHPGSALIAELPDPPTRHGQVLVEGLLAGISRRVPLSWWPEGLAREPGDVKVVVDLTQ